jgi:hypothetical protein
MIEETFLPMRRVFSDATGKAALERSHPLCEREIRTHTDEKMRVIWHENVAPDADTSRNPVHAKIVEALVALSLAKRGLRLRVLNVTKKSGG